ncbi:hypothetical protein BFL36_14165 [Clavibacter michiganensis]|uniref:Lipoprotein n=1 Tax=Clavibacter michiganensis TaxID=28447 RepID=A0A251Y564_9MICO|nr:hypothetical protein [Clavibacter michiganensis]OUE19183.1 hypothetical protein BFL36_14165 [Clavibacter michiganensis]
MRHLGRIATLALAAAVVAGGLSGCGAPRSERCLPAPLTASPAMVAPGGTATVASPAVDCDLGHGSGRTYVIGIASEVLDADGGSVFQEGEEFRVGADGAFVREVVVPEDLPSGPASISVRGSAIDDCDDGESSCAAYQVPIMVGPLP